MPLRHPVYASLCTCLVHHPVYVSLCTLLYMPPYYPFVGEYPARGGVPRRLLNPFHCWPYAQSLPLCTFINFMSEREASTRLERDTPRYPYPFHCWPVVEACWEERYPTLVYALPTTRVYALLRLPGP